MSLSRLLSLAGFSLALAAVATPAGTVKTGATVTVASGPNAGTYSIESVRPCTISPRDDAEPHGFGVDVDTANREKSWLGAQPNELGSVQISIPNIRSAHLGELQIAVVFGDQESRKTAGPIYSVDTVPEGATEQVKEVDELLKRGGAPRKRSGKGGATLADNGPTATLTFWGETAAGVAFKGSIDCRRVSHE